MKNNNALSGVAAGLFIGFLVYLIIKSFVAQGCEISLKNEGVSRDVKCDTGIHSIRVRSNEDE